MFFPTTGRLSFIDALCYLFQGLGLLQAVKNQLLYAPLYQVRKMARLKCFFLEHRKPELQEL